MANLGMYPDEQSLNDAWTQVTLDMQQTESAIKAQEPLVEARQRKEEVEAEIKAEEQRTELLESTQLADALATTTTEGLAASDKGPIDYFTNQFGEFGIIFQDASMIGGNVEAIAPDGQRMTVSVRINGEIVDGEMDRLKNFVKDHGTPSTALDEEEEAVLNRAWRATNLRDTYRTNDDGTHSTVKFVSMEVDGKNVVVPTLFPTDPNNYSNHSRYWTELEGMDAYEEAVKRGEVFVFEDAEEADAFAAGSWKDVNAVDVAAQSFFAEKGLNYEAYKSNYDAYHTAQDELYFINRAPLYLEELSDEEKEKYGDKYYINGVRRNDYLTFTEPLQEEVDLRFDIINDDEYVTITEDFDVEIDKVYQGKAAGAAQVNQMALLFQADLNKRALDAFGVGLNELSTIKPTNDYEVNLLNELNAGVADANMLSQMAANEYQVASTWLDAKFDPNLRGNLVENVEGFTSSVAAGWNRGQAAEEILKLSLGLEDIDDDATRAEIAQAVVDYMAQANTGDVSRVSNRYHQAKGFWEIFQVVWDNPLELSLTLAGESLSQMLPYGTKLVGAGVVTGAGGGALYGSAVPGYGTAGGALLGAGYGARTGFAATSLAMEYTNAVFDAMKNQGYDITDPLQVEQAFLDDNVWEEGKRIGFSRGIPISIVDYFSAGLAGKVFTAGRLSSTPVKASAFVGERLVFDPVAEGVGELSAQIVSGQEISGKDITAEMLGGFGNNTAFGGMNLALDAIANNKISIAQDLMTIDGMMQEKASDSRISSWANKMLELGQITPEQHQRIMENLGLRREANQLVETNNKAVTQRAMELLAAREELSSTTNRKQVFADKIREINAELAELANTKTLRDSESQTVLPSITGVGPAAGTDIRQGVGRYRLNGRDVTKAEFLAAIDNKSTRRLLRAKAEVTNDEEVKAKLDEKLQEDVAEEAVAEVDALLGPSPEVTEEVGTTEEVEVTEDTGVTEEVDATEEVEVTEDSGLQIETDTETVVEEGVEAGVEATEETQVGVDVTEDVDVAEDAGVTEEVDVTEDLDVTEDADVTEDTEVVEATTTLSEEELPGYDRMSQEVNNIIEKSKKRGVKPDKILDNVIKYIQGSRVYETATDTVREQLIREARKNLGVKEKAAPSTNRLLGLLKNVKKITMKESTALKNRIKAEVRAAKGAKKFIAQKQKELADDIRDLTSKGQLTQRQAADLIKKFAKTDITKPKDVDALVDYVTKVFNDSEGRYKRGILKDISKLIKQKAKTATQSGKRKGKSVTPEVQRLMSALRRVARNVIDASSEVSESFIEAESKFLEENQSEIYRIYNKELLEGEKLTPEERQLMDRQVAFDMLGNALSLDLKDTEALLTSLKDLSSESLAKLKEKRAQRAAQYQAEAQEVTEQIQETNPELFDEDGNLLNDDQIEDNRKEYLPIVQRKGSSRRVACYRQGYS